MIIREFKSEDAETILSWIKSEREFKLWSADCYGDFPIAPSDMINFYESHKAQEEYYPLVFGERGKIVGHLILRYPTTLKELMRIGFVIVDNKKRKKGFGTKMIFEAMQYAVKNYNAKVFNLGVFSNNEQAYNLYKKIGFKTVYKKDNFFDFHGENWTWEEMCYNPIEKIVKTVNKYLYN